QTRSAKQSLEFVDRFPAFLERREIPASAASANHPEPSACWVVREPMANGERRDLVVFPERGVAEETGRVHRREYCKTHRPTQLDFVPFTDTTFEWDEQRDQK